MSDYIKREDAIKALEGWKISGEMILGIVPAADVVEVGKPYFYEEGYVLKDFHNDGVHRYFVIERAE